jgi:hypothetical protein
VDKIISVKIANITTNIWQVAWVRNLAQRIESEIEKLEKDHKDESLDDILREFSPRDTPSRYKMAPLRQLCGRYYSSSGTSVGYIEPPNAQPTRFATTSRS